MLVPDTNLLTYYCCRSTRRGARRPPWCCAPRGCSGTAAWAGRSWGRATRSRLRRATGSGACTRTPARAPRSPRRSRLCAARRRAVQRAALVDRLSHLASVVYTGRSSKEKGVAFWVWYLPPPSRATRRRIRVRPRRHQTPCPRAPLPHSPPPCPRVHAPLTPACSAVHRGEAQRGMPTPEQPSAMRFPMRFPKCWRQGPGNVRKDNSRRPSP